jgi:hypothetical protein
VCDTLIFAETCIFLIRTMTCDRHMVQGLSFQIWPSALHLADFARALDWRTPGFWRVCSAITLVPFHCVIALCGINVAGFPLLFIGYCREAQGKYVVELGTGCGLVGLVLACLGAHVLLTDLPHVLVPFKTYSPNSSRCNPC